MVIKIKNSPIILFRILLLLIISVSIYLFIPIKDIIESIYSVNFSFFSISVLISFPAFFLATLSTWILAKRQGIKISLMKFYLFSLSTRFYGFFSPLSAIATGMRWHKLSANDKYAQALSAIAFTRFFSIVAAVFSGIFWTIFKFNQDWKILPFFLVLLGLLFIGWYVTIKFNPYLIELLELYEKKTDQPLIKKIVGFSKTYLDSINIYSTMPVKILFIVIFINFLNDFLGLLAHYFLAQAINIPLSIFDLGWVRSVSFLLSVIPFTLPGGIGIREVTVVVLLTALKVPVDVSAAYSFLVYSRGVVISLICGIFAVGSVAGE